MTRICITGGPRTGKTTLSESLQDILGCPSLWHTDELIDLGWSGASQFIAEHWLTEPGPWIIEGVAASRALRKWRDQHPAEPPPVDRVIYLREPHEELTSGQRSMAKGVETVHREIESWLEEHGITTEYR
jgi:dephospho-CoA kinase